MWTRLGTWELHLPPINPKPWLPRCRTHGARFHPFWIQDSQQTSPNHLISKQKCKLPRDNDLRAAIWIPPPCVFILPMAQREKSTFYYSHALRAKNCRKAAKGFVFVQKSLEFENQWAIFSNDWKFVSFLTMQRVILGGEICEAILWAQGGVWLLRPWRTHLCAAQPQCHCSLYTGTLFSLSWVLSNWLNVGVLSWRYVCLLDQRAQELIQLEHTNVWGRMPVRLLRSELGCSWGFPVTEPNFVSSRGSPITLQIPCS